MTNKQIAQELRAFAISEHVGYVGMSEPAFVLMRAYAEHGYRLYGPEDERRTFALLVAEALESE